MPKGSSKSIAAIERLLEERRQYEAWIVRLSVAEDATPEQVRARVKADYEARLQAVTEELKAHAASARQAIEEKKHFRTELQRKEALVAEKLSETELRHAVGEYDEGQWGQVHKDALAELVTVREQLQAIEGDIEKLQELDAIVRSGPRAPAKGTPQSSKDLDELAFIKSVTEDDKGAAPSPKRASGAQFQPGVPATSVGNAHPPTSTPTASSLPTPQPGDEDLEEPRTLRCRDCGTMNLPTEWYCEQCGAELAAV